MWAWIFIPGPPISLSKRMHLWWLILKIIPKLEATIDERGKWIKLIMVQLYGRKLLMIFWWARKKTGAIYMHGAIYSSRVGSLGLHQQIFPTQESNWGGLHCGRILYQLSYQGSPHLQPQSPKPGKSINNSTVIEVRKVVIWGRGTCTGPLE